MIKLFTRQQGYSTTKRNKSWDVAHVRTDHARGTAEGTVSAKFVMFCILGYVCTVPAVTALTFQLPGRSHDRVVYVLSQAGVSPKG